MSIKKFIREKLKRYLKISKKVPFTNYNQFRINDYNPENIVFCVGTGRCGTHFFSELINKNEDIMSLHLDNIDSKIQDSFVSYCIWNNIDIDMYEFKKSRVFLIKKAQKRNKIYFEANPYLGLTILKLYKWFNAKFIFLLRDPKDVVNSHYNKGWYESSPNKYNSELATGLDYSKPPHYTFGRIIPKGKRYERWRKLTRIGKIAWYVNQLNFEIFTKLEKIPDRNYEIIKIDDFNYNSYIKLNKDFLNLSDICLKDEFKKLKSDRPGKKPDNYTFSQWSKQEINQFYKQTTWLRKTFYRS